MKSLASHCDRLERSGLMGDDTGRWLRLDKRRHRRAVVAAWLMYAALATVFGFTLYAYLNGYTA